MYLALKNALGKSFILFSGLLNKFSGATAAYSLRNLSNTYNGPIVKVRRAIVQDERDFNSYEVNQIEDWVNGKQETTLPADSSFGGATAGYSLRKVNPSYIGSAARIRRASDDVEVNVLFDSQDEVSDSSPITNVVNTVLANETSFPSGTGAFLSSTSGTTYLNGNFEGKNNVLSAGFDGSGLFGLTLNQTYGIGERFKVRYELYYDTELNTGGAPLLTMRNSHSLIGSTSLRAPTDQWFIFEDEFVTTAAGTNLTLHLSAQNPAVQAGDVFLVANASIEKVNDPADTTATTLGAFLTEGGNQDATVHTWYDQSGNGKDATQDTAGSQPKIAEAGNIVTKLGKASIDFTVDVTFLENSSVSITETEVSYFFVWQPAIDGATSTEARNRTLFSIGSDASFIQTPNSSDQMSWRRFTTVNSFTLNIANLNTPNLHTAIGTNSGANYYFNSSSIYSDSLTGSNSNRNGIRIGTRFFVESHRTTGYLSEFLIYNSDESANRFKIESNINNYYGIYTASNDGFVNTWYDQSGNINHAVAPADTNEPKIVSAGSLTTQGGKPCLDFDGVDDVLQFSAPDVQSGNIRSLFIACSAPTSQNKSVMGTEGEFLIKRDSSRAISQNNFGASRLNSAFTFSGTITHLVTVIRNFTAPSSSLSLDGDVDATRTDSYGLSLVHQIGGKKSGSNIIEEADFNCLEVVVYASDQTTNRASIESNIADEYGINIS